MRQYTVAYTAVPMDFSAANVLSIDNLQWSPEVPISAQARICYNEDGLYVCLTAWEPHIRAVEEGPTGAPCLDSCLEFFFCPVLGDRRYFNIEMNPNGCMYLGLGTCNDTLVRLLPEVAPIIPQVTRFDGGWEVQYAVPLSFIRHFFPDYSLVSGMEFRANCYKCGDLTPQAHYLSWNKVELEHPSFHQPDHFGLMHLE